MAARIGPGAVAQHWREDYGRLPQKTLALPSRSAAFRTAPRPSLRDGVRARQSLGALSLSTAVGATLGALRARRCGLAARHCASGSTSIPGAARNFEELSEDELLEYELAEVDLDMGEEEEEEWRQYDEEVKQYQVLQELMELEKAETLAQSSSPSLSMSGEEISGTRPESSGGTKNNSGLGVANVGEADLVDLLATTSGIESQLRSLLEAKRQEEEARAEQERAAAVVSQEIAVGSTALAEYRARLAEGESGIVLNGSAGPQTFVVLSRPSDQPELLPVLSETFRLANIRIIRGRMGTDEGLAMNVFEVCDAKSGKSLSEEEACRLEKSLVQAVRTPASRRILVEVYGQLPMLDSLLGLPDGGSRPPLLSDARNALRGGPFRVSEAHCLDRALAFRGQLEDGADPMQAIIACERRLWSIAPDYDGQWQCFITTGRSDPLLLVLPKDDIEQAVAPPWTKPASIALCVLLCGVAVIYAQAVARSSALVTPPLGLMILSLLGVGEIARRFVAKQYGVRLGVPLLLPSPALGSFGAVSRIESPVPNAAALFDMASAAATMTLLTSLVAITIGLSMPASESTCTWVDPGIFPAVLQRLLYLQSDRLWDVCLEPPPVPLISGGTYVPASTLFVAGSVAAITAALNLLPLYRLDGMSIVAASAWPLARDVLLPWAALFLLGLSVFDKSGSNLLPVMLTFTLFTYFIRPILAPDPIFRENVTQPRDFQRRGTGFVLYGLAFMVLCPSVLLNLFSGTS